MPQLDDSVTLRTTTRVPAAARLNRLPVTSLHRRIMLVLGFVFFFDHADINTLAFAAPAIMKFWNIKVTTIALFNSATFTGMFLGSVFGGMISDRIGRKRAMIGNAVIYGGFSLLNAFAWDPFSLFVTRMLTGVGISAMTVVGIAYISEIYPARVRGSFQGWVMTFGLAGVPCTALVARTVVPMGPWGWRLIFVWGSLGLLFPLFASALEESPRWYENHGRFDEADAVLDRIEARVRSESGELPRVDLNVAPEAVHRNFTDLFGQACLPRTATLVCVWICLTMGFFGFTSWVPTLLVAHGFSLVHSLTFSLAMTIAAIPGAGLAGLFSDRFDRKWSITVIAILIAVCGALYGMTFKVAFIIFFGFLVEMFIHTSMPLTYSYTAESFPSGIRNSGTGLAYGAGRLANIFGPLLIAFIFNHYGYKSVFAYISGLWIMVALIVFIFGVRSRTLVERAL